ncbi:MAG: bifunctional (p)ppGpp synthetase/guanosine-3',5'-bis(diphosphate) 3'-pyrophosphohydrolase, partial [Bacteroidales bacterium]|nr:bifunctional (p)ppGpp synthetase/guanosine-3',5'-bis(diphosphate) 3'-pyrophosphohydrolase [Bacteroidales bacterium]
THKGQYIRKGYPYILHPIEVARIASDEIGLGVNSIVASFLHEVLDAGNITVKQIKLEFGEIVAIIVEGLSKISSINSNTNVLHAENFRKFLLTMANDIRVILVKIADRLHNMRNLKYKNANRQLKMALETSYLYAPLAHRLGLYPIKSELEDLALKYLDSETYQYIDKNLKNTKQKREKYIKSFIAPINNRLKEEGLKFEIKGRTKSITSIWNKIKKQNVDFESIYDIYAIRIIIDAPLPKEKELCWKVYSVVTDIYQPNPQRLRDWLSVPKSNGYESLHITVLGSDGKWVEVQIRTIRMDEIAEKGFAAHYMYKGIQGSGSEVEDWLSKMRELLETPGENLSEFVDNVQLNLYSDEIFVFTPKGDIKKLPVNSTVLDFAYDIHTEIGNRCAGAKINNKNAGIKQILENGDQVEIITSKNQKPKSDWLGFVITSKAKSKIKASLNEEKLKEAQLGKEILKRRLKNWKIEFTDEVVRKLLKHYKLINATDFYSQLSDKTINIIEVKDVLANDEETLVEKKAEIIEDVKVDQFSDDYKILSTDILIIENKIKGIDYKFAKCCNPIFGDKIFGFVTINEGIKIHRYNCPNAPQLLARYPYRVVRAKWTKTEGVKVFQSVIKINGINNAGLLSHISDLISKDPNVTIRNISVSNNDGLFEGILTILVQDKHHLDAILMKLLKIKGVTRALRLNQ